MYYAPHQYTAPDLSEIAKTLDALEESYDDQNTGGSSTNMDDTGVYESCKNHDAT